MIPYTRKHYLDTIEKGIKKLLSSTSIPVGQLEEMAYMISELKKEEENPMITIKKDALKNLKDEVQFLKEKVEEREQQYAELERAIEEGEVIYL